MTDPPAQSANPERAAVLRILDANLNRATEGLRVVEEYARFVLDDGELASRCKQLRHALVASLADVPPAELLAARDTTGDVGTTVTAPGEYERTDALGVVTANFKRLQQSLRSLEEYGKIVSATAGPQLERVRYDVYELEKRFGGIADSAARLSHARLYVLVDGGATTEECIQRCETLIAAGVHVLQLRDKKLPDRELLQRARALRRATQGRCLLIVNDRPDIAALSHADGVHVGQDELPVADARKIVGPRVLIGVSTHNIEQARQAARDGADYIGCGPTFPSGTKIFQEFPGVAFLRTVAKEIKLPVFAIGGISLQNLDQVMTAGINRVAVGGGITNASDPTAAVREFISRLPVPPAPSE